MTSVECIEVIGRRRIFIDVIWIRTTRDSPRDGYAERVWWHARYYARVPFDSLRGTRGVFLIGNFRRQRGGILMAQGF